MSPSRPFFTRSRSSHTRITTMPVISEDDDLSKVSSSTASTSEGGTATTDENDHDANTSAAGGIGVAFSSPAAPHQPPRPLRVPPKTYRRPTPATVHHYLHGQQYAQQKKQQYPGPPTLYLSEKMAAAAAAAGGDADRETRFKRLLSPWKWSRRGRGTDYGDDERRRRVWFLILIAVAAVVVIALAIGLPVGLLNKHHSSSPSQSSSPPYPAGSWSFNTTLQQSATACTSNPTTWRCFPYSDGGAATFYWVITAPSSTSSKSSSSSGNYTVSSTDNPFAPVFSSVPAAMLDQGQPSERLVFSFGMNRTVVPGNALTPTNRAASCSYPGTRFDATLWTRRAGAGGRTLDPVPTTGGTKFAVWPADVEVSQSANATLGEPRCVDVDGNFIADVQAGAGQCQCLYASFPDS